MLDSVYMVYIPVYSVYAIHRGVHVSIVFYMVYIPVYSVYAIYTGVHVSIVLHMVYIPVYSVYAIYGRDKSVCWTVCI